MDLGHYNCRDYYITPHFSAPTLVTDLPRRGHELAFQRHESFDELEQRSRSPASFKPKFPLLRLPLELRQQILSYLLPRTIEKKPPIQRAHHGILRSIDAEGNVDKICNGAPSSSVAETRTLPVVNHIVWQRGNVKLMGVCRQLHEECADMMYGGNTFLLFVTYTGIVFRYSWMIRSGLSPTKRYPFLELMPERYRIRIQRVVVNVEHVDGYTGMIKFNVSNQGLIVGLRKQVQRLVNALQPGLDPECGGDEEDTARAASGGSSGNDATVIVDRRPHLAKVHIRVSTSNSIVDAIKRLREGDVTSAVSADLEQMLAPFEDLRGVRDVAVTGAVPVGLAKRLCERMASQDLDMQTPVCRRRLSDDSPRLQLCVYGNDL